MLTPSGLLHLHLLITTYWLVYLFYTIYFKIFIDFYFTLITPKEVLSIVSTMLFGQKFSKTRE